MLRKFNDIIHFDDYEVLTSEGFKPFNGIGKTIEYQEFKVYFKNHPTPLICADDHILISFDDNSEIFAKNLKVGDRIVSKEGRAAIVDKVIVTEHWSEMYDLLEVEGETYFTDDVLSHNTTVSVGAILHYVLFNEHFKAAILANKDTLAKETLNKALVALEHLPDFLSQGIKSQSVHDIRFENGSSIIARPTSRSGIRGLSQSLILLDEYAHLDSNLAAEFYKSNLPAISSGKTSKLIIISTPNGYNHFHKLWIDAKAKRNTFNPVRVDWWEVEGRDEEWKQEQIANSSIEDFKQEYDLSFDTKANTLINSDKLKQLTEEYRPPLKQSEENTMMIYEEPQKDASYIMTVDTATGAGRDYSAFLVIKISSNPHEVVAVYRNSVITPLSFPELIVKVAENYNQAHILVEANDASGGQVAYILSHELQYPKFFYTSTKRNTSFSALSFFPSENTIPGIKVTTNVKNVGCTNLKSVIENNKINIYDFDIINEISTFIRRNNTFRAEEGSNDDLVMCLVLYAWLLTQSNYSENDNIIREVRGIHEKINDEKLIAMGFFVTGLPEDDFSLDPRLSEEDMLDKKYGWVLAEDKFQDYELIGNIYF